MALNSFKFLADFTELDLPVILLAIPIAVYHRTWGPGLKLEVVRDYDHSPSRRRPAGPGITLAHKMKSTR